MAIKHHQDCRSQSIISFNPTCCLRPPRTHDDLTRCSDYGPTTCSSSIPSSQALIGRREPSSVREPSSPTVGCLGQVKRSNTAKGHYNKLLKLSRVLSGRSMPISLKPSSKVGVIELDVFGTSRSAMTSIEDMDPPLPVVIKKADADNASLWKRRHAGEGIKGLQLQQLKVQQIQPLRLHRRQSCA